MKRKKQIVRNIILIALTALLFLWQGGYHLTPEAVFRSAEKAEWLGPAAEVIEVGQRDDGCLCLAGMEEKGFFSMALDSYMPRTMDYGVREVICKNAAGEVIGKDSQ